MHFSGNASPLVPQFQNPERNKNISCRSVLKTSDQGVTVLEVSFSLPFSSEAVYHLEISEPYQLCWNTSFQGPKKMRSKLPHSCHTMASKESAFRQGRQPSCSPLHMHSCVQGKLVGLQEGTERCRKEDRLLSANIWTIVMKKTGPMEYGFGQQKPEQRAEMLGFFFTSFYSSKIYIHKIYHLHQFEEQFSGINTFTWSTQPSPPNLSRTFHLPKLKCCFH